MSDSLDLCCMHLCTHTYSWTQLLHTRPIYFLTFVNHWSSFQSLLRLSGLGGNVQKADGSSRRWEFSRQHDKHGGKQAKLEYSPEMLDENGEVQYVLIGRGINFSTFAEIVIFQKIYSGKQTKNKKLLEYFLTTKEAAFKLLFIIKTVIFDGCCCSFLLVFSKHKVWGK